MSDGTDVSIGFEGGWPSTINGKTFPSKYDLIVEANYQDGTPEDQAWFRARHTAYPPDALVEPGRLRQGGQRQNGVF